MFFEVNVDLGKGFVHLAQKFKVQNMTVCLRSALRPLGVKATSIAWELNRVFF